MERQNKIGDKKLVPGISVETRRNKLYAKSWNFLRLCMRHQCAREIPNNFKMERLKMYYFDNATNYFFGHWKFRNLHVRTSKTWSVRSSNSYVTTILQFRRATFCEKYFFNYFFENEMQRNVWLRRQNIGCTTISPRISAYILDIFSIIFWFGFIKIIFNLERYFFWNSIFFVTRRVLNFVNIFLKSCLNG